MMLASWMARILYCAAKFDLADHLAGGPRSADDLARVTNTHAPSLYRLMRTLASLGVLTEDASHRFALGPLGEAMRTGAPGAARSSVLILGRPWWQQSLDELPYSIETGNSGFEKVLGKPVFDWLVANPEEAKLFNDLMIGVHGEEPAAIAAAYDFNGCGTIVDVGGGTGNLLTTILSRHPAPRGVLFDLEHVVREAAALIASRGLTDRVTTAAGSFYERIPPGGDVYLLSHVIHDWSEDQCLTILGNCRAAMAPGSRLLIIEMVLPPGDTPHPGKLLDMMMLVGPGGQERTAEEYGALLQKAGMKMTRVVPTASPVSLVEAVVA
jgi:hypothetical protein